MIFTPPLPPGPGTSAEALKGALEDSNRGRPPPPAALAPAAFPPTRLRPPCWTEQARLAAPRSPAGPTSRSLLALFLRGLRSQSCCCCFELDQKRKQRDRPLEPGRGGEGQGRDPGDSRALGSGQLHTEERRAAVEPVAGGMRVPGVGALLLRAVDTHTGRRLQNISICGHGPTAGFLPPARQGGGRVGNRKTRQGQRHTAEKMVTIVGGGGGRVMTRSFAINTPEHLCARNWGPQNRGLSPCLQSRGDLPSTGLPQKGGRRTEAQVPRGALTVQGPRAGGLSRGVW